MRPVEVGAIALGLATVLSGACSKSSSQGSKEPSASTQPPAQTPQAQQQPKSQTPAIGGGPTEPAPATPKSAVSSLAAAECDHEVQCNNVGQDKAYKTRDECVTKMQREKRKGINDKVCTGGINQGNLNGCVQALRDEACGNPMSALERMSACKTDSICVKHAKKK